MSGDSSSRFSEPIERAIGDGSLGEVNARGGIGTRLSELVADIDWPNDFVIGRDVADRDPPNFLRFSSIGMLPPGSHD